MAEIKTAAVASEGRRQYAHCNNGGCVRPIYRTQFCFRCWAGVKWVSIWQRIQNKNGNNPSYAKVTLGFMKADFIQWVLDNPPPVFLLQPSIDRIIPELGYSPGNIRWIEKRKNSSNTNRDLPDGMKLCAICKQVKAATPENFVRAKNNGFSYCHPCNRVYQANWRKTRAARI